jgi:hypothetical protein
VKEDDRLAPIDCGLDRERGAVEDAAVVAEVGELEQRAIAGVDTLHRVAGAALGQRAGRNAAPREAAARATHVENLGVAVADFEPLPFDGEAASRFGTLVPLTLATDLNPRPRRLDLMIAAIASVRGPPLFTRNADDFEGLEDTVPVVPVWRSTQAVKPGDWLSRREFGTSVTWRAPAAQSTSHLTNSPPGEGEVTASAQDTAVASVAELLQQFVSGRQR